MTSREQAIERELALRAEYKALAYITGRQARFLYGYLENDFIAAIDQGLALYDNKGNQLTAPLGSLAEEYTRREVAKLQAEHDTGRLRNTRLNQHSNYLSRINWINDNAVSCVLEEAFFYQPQLVSIMQAIHPDLAGGKAKKGAGAPVQTEARTKTAKTVERLIGESLDKLPTMAATERLTKEAMRQAGEGLSYHQQQCRETYKALKRQAIA